VGRAGHYFVEIGVRLEPWTLIPLFALFLLPWLPGDVITKWENWKKMVNINVATF